MGHESYQRAQPANQATPRQFGWLLSLVLALLAGWSAWKGSNIWPLWSTLVLATLAISLWRPAWLAKPLRGWMALGMLLGRIVNPLLLGLMYALLFVPLGLWFRLIGRDGLQRRFDTTAESYWIERQSQELGARMRRPF